MKNIRSTGTNWMTELSRKGIKACMGLAAVALASCDQPPPEASTPAAAPPPPAVAPAVTSEKVAQAKLATGAELTIYALSDGGFYFTQTGDGNATPASVNSKLVADGDPVALFKELAPSSQVPERLVHAVQRAKDQGVVMGPDRSGMVEDVSSAAPRSDSRTLADNPVSVVRQAALPGSSGSTGTAGCPWEFFTPQLTGSTYCPQTDRTLCGQSLVWGWMEHGSAIDGVGTMCGAWGHPMFEVYINSGLVESHFVSAGTWRTMGVLAKRTCTWWGSCSFVRNHLKFNFPYDGLGATAHFGVKLGW